MSVLAFFLRFAAGHRCILATVFHVAACCRVLIAILRSCGERRRGNGKCRATCEADYEGFKFSHLSLLSKESRGLTRDRSSRYDCHRFRVAGRLLDKKHTAGEVSAVMVRPAQWDRAICLR